MPFNVDPGDKIENSAYQPFAPAEDSDGVSLGMQMEAAFMLDNTVAAAGQYVVDQINLDQKPAAGYNVWDDLTDEEKFNGSFYGDADSPEELAYLRQMAKREATWRENVDAGPVPAMLATMGAIAFDPLTWVPVAGALGKGGNMALKFARGAAAGAIENAASEAALQSLQQERPLDETMWAIGLGGAFGLIGAGGAAAIGARRQKLIQSAINDQVALSRWAEAGEFGDAGAKYAPYEADKEATKFVGHRILNKWGEWLGKNGLAAPSIELGASRFNTARKVAHMLADTGMVLRSHVEGFSPFGASADTQIRQADRMLVGIDQLFRAGYSEAQTAGTKMSKLEFHEAVARAGRRGDASADPAVAATAKALREHIFEKLGKQADSEILGGAIEAAGGAPKGAKSYFTRIISSNKVAAGVTNGKGQTFQNVIEEWVNEQATAAGKVLEEGDAQTIAEALERQIHSSAGGRIPDLEIELRGPLKGRTLDIDDLRIEPWLENDAQLVASRYVKTVASDLAFKRTFGELTPEKVIKDLYDEANEEIAKLKAGDPEAGVKAITGQQLERESRKITDLAKRQEQVIRTAWDRIRGTDNLSANPAYAGLRSAGQVLRTYTFTKSLGSVALAQLPDAFKIMAEEGLTRTFGAIFADLFTGFKGLKMGIKQAREFGTALDLYNNQRVASILSLGDQYTNSSGFNRSVAKAGNSFAKWTGMSHVNTFSKGVASMAVTTRILSAAEKVAKAGGDMSVLSKSDLRRVAQSRLNKEDLLAFAKEAENFDRIGSNIFAGTEKWADKKLARKLELAVLQDIDNAVITPNELDAFLWTGTEWGKTIFQFKRFSAAANQRVLIAGLQKRDAATLTAMVGMVGAGALSLYLRDLTTEHGRKRIESRTTREWIRDSIDRSGIFTVAMELDNLGTSVGLRPTNILTGTDSPKFMSQGITSRTMGPVANAIDDLATAVGNTASGDFTRNDLRRWEKLLPGQNHFALAWLLEMAHQGVSDALELPERTRR